MSKPKFTAPKAQGKPESAKPKKVGFSEPQAHIEPFPDAMKLMPAYRDIPDEYRDMCGETPFHKIQQQWFFEGLKKFPLDPKPGINRDDAIRHLAAIQGSWAPKHEHKVAGVAYLMSLWFEAPKEAKQ